DTGLFPFEALFENDLVAGGAKNAMNHHVVDRVMGLVLARSDDHALPRRDAVRLDHEPRSGPGFGEKGTYASMRLLVIVGAPICGRGDPVPDHQLLRKELAALDARGIGRRAKN